MIFLHVLGHVLGPKTYRLLRGAKLVKGILFGKEPSKHIKSTQFTALNRIFAIPVSFEFVLTKI